MDERLTKQDKKFVKELVEHGNQTEAAKEAYGYEDSNVAGVMANRKLRNVKIQNAIQSIADQIPDDKLVKVLNEGLEAGKHIYKNNNESGEIEDMGIEADYAVRHKYLDTALKIKGAYEVDENKNINILMPVLVKYLDKKDDEANNN